MSRMITLKQTGDFKKLTGFLEKEREKIHLGVLDKYGRMGVKALSAATPVNTGLTASSWYYEITQTEERATLSFWNSNVQNGVPIAIILQYGHATRNGGWVEGRDYINPAIQPIFDQMAKDVWKEATSS